LIIGIDTSAVGKKATGTSRYIECLLTELKKTKHAVKTFSPVQTKPSIKTSLFDSIPIIKRGGIRRHLYRKFELSSQMNNTEVDCGIFPNYLMPLNFNKQSAVVIHDLSFLSHPHFYSKAFVWYYANQLKKVLGKKPLIVTISAYSLESINKYLGVNKNEIYLLQAYVKMNKPDTKQISKTNVDGRKYFLYVGHIEPRKNLSFLIEHFLEWKKGNGLDYKLILVGDVWSGSKDIRSLLICYRDHPDIEFTGYATEDELCQLYLNASAFVHTSFVEGFGFPVLDAMHYGLPVLCSTGSGTEEISRPYSITIDPTNGRDLQKGLDKLISKLHEPDCNYSIKYSSELMQEQLDKLLSAFERKING